MEKTSRKVLTIILAMALLMIVIPSNINANEITYTEIISPTYDDARKFSEGLAAVKRGNKWGYINESEEVVIDFQYDRAYSFSEGKALVEKHIKEEDYYLRYYYIITPDNNSVPLKYAGQNVSIYDPNYNDDDNRLDVMYDTTLYNGYILVPANSATEKFVFDEYGEAFDDAIYLPTEGTLAKYDHYSLIDSEEYVMLYDDLGFISARPFNQGMAPVYFEDPKEKNGYYYSFLKKDGTLWSGPKFYDFYVNGLESKYQIFNNNSLASIMNSEGKWGAVNKEGETIIPFKYELLKTFNEGVAAFSKNGKFGYIDIHGNEVIQPQFDDTTGFNNGLAAVLQGNTAYIIDKQGNKVKGSENIQIEAYFKDGDIVSPPSENIIINENNKFGFAKLEYNETIINVTGVSLDQTKLEIKEGQEARLVATISPIDATNKNLTWSSSNEKVATVDGYGKVTARSAGTTTITVTTEDGKHTATSEVTVKEPGSYDDYKTWETPLEHDSIHHSWTITFNMNIDEKTVNDSSVYIIDKDNNKLDFIHLKTENSENTGLIVLENSGGFEKNEDYWIIVEDTVQSIDGKRLGKGLKAQFMIR